MRKILILIILLISKVSINANDTIFLTNPILFTNYIGSSDGYDVLPLSKSRFVVAYDRGGIWQGLLRFGEINRDLQVRFSDSVVFTSEMSFHRVQMCKLSENSFLLIYNDNYSTTLQGGEITGNQYITLGSSTILKTDYYESYSIKSIGNNKFIVAYYDDATDFGLVSVGKVDINLNVSITSTCKFSKTTLTNSDYVSLDTLSKSKFVISYGYWNGNSVIGSIDTSDNITFGSEYSFTLNEAYNIDVVSLTENQFAIVYGDQYDKMYGTVMLGNISNNDQITYSKKFYINQLDTRGIQATRLKDQKIVIAYYSSLSGESCGYITEAEIKNNAVTFNKPEIHNKAIGGNSINTVAMLDSSQFIVGYHDGNSYYGYVRIGTVQKLFNTELKELSESNNSIYPNPFCDYLVVNSENTDIKKIEIFDLNSQIIKIINTCSNEAFVDTKELKKGVYIIKVLTSNGFIIKKILK